LNETARAVGAWGGGSTGAVAGMEASCLEIEGSFNLTQDKSISMTEQVMSPFTH
jgi:hypothetical protein